MIPSTPSASLPAQHKHSSSTQALISSFKDGIRISLIQFFFKPRPEQQPWMLLTVFLLGYISTSLLPWWCILLAFLLAYLQIGRRKRIIPATIHSVSPLQLGSNLSPIDTNNDIISETISLLWPSLQVYALKLQHKINSKLQKALEGHDSILEKIELSRFSIGIRPPVLSITSLRRESSALHLEADITWHSSSCIAELLVSCHRLIPWTPRVLLKGLHFTTRIFLTIEFSASPPSDSSDSSSNSSLFSPKCIFFSLAGPPSTHIEFQITPSVLGPVLSRFVETRILSSFMHPNRFYIKGNEDSSHNTAPAASIHHSTPLSSSSSIPLRQSRSMSSASPTIPSAPLPSVQVHLSPEDLETLSGALRSAIAEVAASSSSNPSSAASSVASSPSASSPVPSFPNLPSHTPSALPIASMPSNASASAFNPSGSASPPQPPSPIPASPTSSAISILKLLKNADDETKQAGKSLPISLVGTLASSFDTLQVLAFPATAARLNNVPASSSVAAAVLDESASPKQFDEDVVNLLLQKENFAFLLSISRKSQLADSILSRLFSVDDAAMRTQVSKLCSEFDARDIFVKLMDRAAFGTPAQPIRSRRRITASSSNDFAF